MPRPGVALREVAIRRLPGNVFAEHLGHDALASTTPAGVSLDMCSNSSASCIRRINLTSSMAAMPVVYGARRRLRKCRKDRWNRVCRSRLLPLETAIARPPLPKAREVLDDRGSVHLRLARHRRFDPAPGGCLGRRDTAKHRHAARPIRLGRLHLFRRDGEAQELPPRRDRGRRQRVRPKPCPDGIGGWARRPPPQPHQPKRNADRRQGGVLCRD